MPEHDHVPLLCRRCKAEIKDRHPNARWCLACAPIHRRKPRDHGLDPALWEEECEFGCHVEFDALPRSQAPYVRHTRAGVPACKMALALKAADQAFRNRTRMPPTRIFAGERPTFDPLPVWETAHLRIPFTVERHQLELMDKYKGSDDG